MTKPCSVANHFFPLISRRVEHKLKPSFLCLAVFFSQSAIPFYHIYSCRPAHGHSLSLRKSAQLLTMILLDSSSRAAKNSRKSPLLFRRVELDRYDPDNPFPLIDPASKRQDVKPKVHVLSIRRLSYLWGILLWFAPFNVLLPAGILLYCVGICCVRELLMEMEEQELSLALIQQEAWERQRQKELFELQYERAMFELHVMQGRRHVRLVSRIEDGEKKLYAIG